MLDEFTQTAATYPGTLDQLAGEPYADYLQSLEISADDSRSDHLRGDRLHRRLSVPLAGFAHELPRPTRGRGVGPHLRHVG